jgi:ArsR family transcriptional regulator, arsenate/arsenite/antimonite-responsive transcriptional repressor
MENIKKPERIASYADMFAAMGNDARLRIMRLLLSAHPDGLIAGDIQTELNIPKSTLSHHLDKLKHEKLVNVRRNGTFLWYSADADALQEILVFLYAECCTRNHALNPDQISLCCGKDRS